MAKQHEGRQSRVAIVGSGLAGLTTAYLLHNDPGKRYSVKVFEAHDSISLDAASVSVPNATTGTTDCIDVPMRSFAAGYYSNLKAMYDHLHIRYHPQPFFFSFSRPKADGNYFVHSSNNHRLPPLKPASVSYPRYFAEVVFILLAYAYWTFLVAFIQPFDEESLAGYLSRLRVPSRFSAYYLLPLMSAVSTCSHADMLAFPARDVLEYKQLTQGRQHYSVFNGVRDVSATLSRGVEIAFSCWVVDVTPSNRGVQVTLEHRNGRKITAKSSEHFDHVVLAVAPPVVMSVFAPLRERLAKVPFTLVDSTVATDEAARLAMQRDAGFTRSGAAELITFDSSDDQTVSTHIQRGGTLVQTRLSDATSQPDTRELHNLIKTSRFPRVLRTLESRRIVNALFGCAPAEDTLADEKRRLNRPWQNGDDNVWLAGGWCWDGMVLLEGCVVSAMRVATRLGVEIPWAPQRS